MVAKDVLLNPERSFNIVLEQWSSQLACFAYKLQSLQLDMAEFACVNAIMLFEQGKLPTYFQLPLNEMINNHAPRSSWVQCGSGQDFIFNCFPVCLLLLFNKCMFVRLSVHVRNVSLCVCLKNCTITFHQSSHLFLTMYVCLISRPCADCLNVVHCLFFSLTVGVCLSEELHDVPL